MFCKNFQTILITGGAGFVGSCLAISFKRDYSDIRVIAMDNLKRRGSELNIQRLKDNGIEFIHGDIRNPEDFLSIGDRVDTVIECSAEPSVMAGYENSPQYLINTNLVGTINCLNYAKKVNAAIIFLSTNRVYPIANINNLEYEELDTRFNLKLKQNVSGVSSEGISEDFSLNGVRSIYGATKLCSELLLQEYCEAYNIPIIINRCGVLTGPWQMGKIDQGFLVQWIAHHIYGKSLNYIGFGGKGKQVRDILHVNDLYSLIKIQLSIIKDLNGGIFNVGGGPKINISLCELTELCRKKTGFSMEIGVKPSIRYADIKWYISDYRKISVLTDWHPQWTTDSIIEDVIKWIIDNKNKLEPILIG